MKVKTAAEYLREELGRIQGHIKEECTKEDMFHLQVEKCRKAIKAYEAQEKEVRRAINSLAGENKKDLT